jgi:hypothetical protein
MLPGEATCATCVFFNRSRPPHDHGGQCRHGPPKLSFGKEGTRSLWPLVYLDSWCGQHSTLEEEIR